MCVSVIIVVVVLIKKITSYPRSYIPNNYIKKLEDIVFFSFLYLFYIK